MDPPSRPTRREVLVGIAGGAALAVLQPSIGFAKTRSSSGSPAPGAVTLDEFMRLSEILTDNEFSLRDAVGAQYQAAIDPAALRRLVQATVRAARPPQTFNDVLRSGALNDATNAATAQRILTYWYSGLVGGRTADYLEALAWESLDDGHLATVSSEPYGFPKWEERP